MTSACRPVRTIMASCAVTLNVRIIITTSTTRSSRPFHQLPRKRNPHVFKGRYITITRQADGSLRPNFRPMKVDEYFSIERFAVGVANELMLALECLIEK